MTEARKSFAEMRRELAASRGRTLEEPSKTHVFDDDLIPDVTDDGISEAAQAVNEACDSIDIFEVYDRPSKGVYENRRQITSQVDGIKISCPIPGHADNHPSASIDREKQTWHCHACEIGGDKFTIAGYAFGLDTKTEFWAIKTRMAEQLRGVKYQRPTTPAPAPVHPETRLKLDQPFEPPSPEPDPIELRIAEKTQEQLIYLEARDRANKIRSADLFEPFAILTFEEESALPQPEVKWTIEGLHKVNHNCTITAAYKTGKSTLMANLTKCPADGIPFLGEHAVREIDGRIAYFNFELTMTDFHEYFQPIGLVNVSKVVPLQVADRRLDLMDDAAFEWTASEMKRLEVEVAILDPFSGAYYGEENSNSEVSAFTKRLNEWKRHAGVTDLFIPVHTGRTVEEGNERARGATKLDDWADARWIYAKHTETGDRYLGGTVRTVGVIEERETRMNPNGLITYSAFKGTRKQKAGNVLRGNILAFVSLNPGCGSNEITDGVMGKTEAIRAELKKLINDFDVVVIDGANRKRHHYLQGEQPFGGVPE